MQSILEQITDWLKSMIISGIMGNLSGMFDSVNQQVGQIAGDVGTTPANFSPAVFSMIRNISESVILPIAGMVLTFIACYELIQMLIEHNNLANFETWTIPTASKSTRTCRCCRMAMRSLRMRMGT